MVRGADQLGNGLETVLPLGINFLVEAGNVQHFLDAQFMKQQNGTKKADAEEYKGQLVFIFKSG